MASPFPSFSQRRASLSPAVTAAAIAKPATLAEGISAAVTVQPPSSGYQGASQTSRMRQWIPNRNHINTLLAAEAPLLRARTRQLIANSPYGANASETFVSYATGTGIVPSPKIATPGLRAAIKTAWTDWTDEADADGLTDFYGLQNLAARALFDAGEVFVRRRDRFASDGLSVPMQLQLLEAEQLDQAFTMQLPNGNAIRQGIEFNAIGKRVAYHFWRSHPGDFTQGQLGERTRVPADQVLHVFKPLRPGQIRGRPWLTAAMVKMFDLDQWDDAQLLRQKFAAFFMAFIEQEQGDINDTGLVNEDTVADEKGTAEVDMEPGLAHLLPKGHKVVFSDTPDVGANYEPFYYRGLLALCAAMGLPYFAVSGDTSKANYSSLRAALLEVRRRIEQFQHETLVFQLCRPVYNWWLPLAVMVGTVRIPGFAAAPRIYSRVNWITPRWDWVDPLKDMQAEKLAVDNGFKARGEVIEGMGNDPNEVDERIAEDQSRETRLGLKFVRGGQAPQASQDDNAQGDNADGQQQRQPGETAAAA